MEDKGPETEAMEQARPQYLPRPTYFPFFFALSLMFFLWGLISLWLISVTGFLGMIVSLIGWIKDMLHERDSGT